MRGIVMKIVSDTGIWRVQRTFQIVAMGAFLLLAVTMVIATALAAAGVLPWLSLPLAFSDGSVYAAGPIVQSVLAGVALLLCAYLPGNWRMLQLENSHRTFQIRMEDVANAYWAVHEADRSGVFKLASEYDAVKERMIFLRDHPDLGHLEPEVLEVAAQMGRISEELAERYSDDAVARATDFLARREMEVTQMQARLETAQAASTELRRWHDRVEVEEAVARSQMARLREELDTLLPAMGLELTERPDPQPTLSPDVIPLPRKSRKSPSIAAE